MYSRIFFVLWTVAILIGFSLLMYDSFRTAEFRRPSSVSETGLDIVPTQTSFIPQYFVSQTPTLLFFAHPHCPCTRASFDELEHILHSTQSQAYNTHIIFFQPDSTEPRSLLWMQASDLWHRAQNFSRTYHRTIHTLTDTNGRIAQAYHVTASGHTILFDAHQTILFEGGITPSRGHIGDNPGIFCHRFTRRSYTINRSAYSLQDIYFWLLPLFFSVSICFATLKGIFSSQSFFIVFFSGTVLWTH